MIEVEAVKSMVERLVRAGLSRREAQERVNYYAEDYPEDLAGFVDWICSGEYLRGDLCGMDDVEADGWA